MRQRTHVIFIYFFAHIVPSYIKILQTIYTLIIEKPAIMELTDCVIAVVILIVIMMIIYLTHKGKDCPAVVKYIPVPVVRRRPLRWCPVRQMWM